MGLVPSGHVAGTHASAVSTGVSLTAVSTVAESFGVDVSVTAVSDVDESTTAVSVVVDVSELESTTAVSVPTSGRPESQKSAPPTVSQKPGMGVQVHVPSHDTDPTPGQVEVRVPHVGSYPRLHPTD
jgi:hypothetical protein